jgi:ATP-dependent Clp protease adaptor protein ClpS
MGNITPFSDSSGVIVLITPAFLSRPMSIVATQAPVARPQEKQAAKTLRKPYPNFKVIVLNDDFNTFQHVTQCLLKYIPNLTVDRAQELTEQIHFEGQAIVWVGPQEQAELYHMQLQRAGLTMAPLEAA